MLATAPTWVAVDVLSSSLYQGSRAIYWRGLLCLVLEKTGRGCDEYNCSRLQS